MVKKYIAAMILTGSIIGSYYYKNDAKTGTPVEKSEAIVKVDRAQEKIESEVIGETEEILLDVPLLNQMDSPRLYNGCEVTSLAMILNFKGIGVTKNELAGEITRVPWQYSNGDYGNPNIGFVGNMEDGPGLGVYHDPIYQLAQKYAQTKDLTNQPFNHLLQEVANGNPIWVITTSTFAPVSEFQSWQTPEGSVDITYKMHSVVITGYDADNIYINNPYGMKNQKVNRESFIQAWEQMGKQAIVIL